MAHFLGASLCAELSMWTFSFHLQKSHEEDGIIVCILWIRILPSTCFLSLFPSLH